MVRNLNLVKGHDCSDSNVLKYASVKNCIFCGSFIRLYARTLVRPYEGPFLTQAGLFLDIDVVPDEVRCTVNWLHYLNYEDIPRSSITRY